MPQCGRQGIIRRKDHISVGELTHQHVFVNLQFYSQTPCERFPDYPSDIREVRVFAFDDKDVLVGEFSDRNMVLSADYSLPATLRQT